jgi:prepilin-type N-terminal cleavage/methylation domain-containing protein
MNMEKEHHVRGRSGMTLVELMISLVIFGVVIAVVFGFLTESRRSYTATRQKAQYQQGLRAVMSLVTREVRSAGCDPGGRRLRAILDRFGRRRFISGWT